MIRLQPSQEPTASILVLTNGRLDLLSDCLRAIARCTDPETTHYEVVVLFQQLSAESVRQFVNGVSGIRPLSVRLNLGFGGGINFAAKHAKGKYLVFLNDDSEPHPDWLHALVKAIESDERSGAVGSRILFPDGSLQEAGGVVWSDGSTMPIGRGERSGSLAYSYNRRVDYTSANGMIVRSEDFRRVGGFDSRYFPAYYEDTDLCLSIRHNLGREIIYEPHSVISHVEAASSPDPDFREFLFRRNRAQFVEKWGNALGSYPAPAPASPIAVESAVLRRRGNGIRVLVVDDRLPDSGGGFGGVGSGFVRAGELFRDLRDYAVTLYATHPPRHNTLAELGVDIVTEPLAEHLSRPGKRYDIAIVSRPHNYQVFAEIIRAAMPGVPIIYDAEALYHRRLWRQAAIEPDALRKGRLESQAQEMEELERRIAQSADRLVVIASDERDWFERVADHAPIDFMPPLLSNIPMTPAKLDDRTGAVFVAGWLGGSASPNVDATTWYYNEVLPLVRAALPSFCTVVTGKNPPLAIQALSCDALAVAGFVESIDELYSKARIAVIPMRVGAGVKNKTMEALQFGVPVVSTMVGAEGLDIRDGVDADVTDDPRHFADRIVALMTDDALWHGRREAIQARVDAWQSERLPWNEVVGRARTMGGNNARNAS